MSELGEIGTSAPRFVTGEPRMLRCLSGRWMAVSDERATVRIGVEGATEDEARFAFTRSAAAWESLLIPSPEDKP